MIIERRQQPRRHNDNNTDKPHCRIVRLSPKELTTGQKSVYLAYQPGTGISAVGSNLVEAWLAFAQVYPAGHAKPNP